MSRRKHRSGMTVTNAADPGKDLFAYLFLMVMVFCFMLLMSAAEVSQSMNARQAPEKKESAPSSSLAAVSVDNIGRLLKKNESVYLAFGDALYDPKTDIDRLETDGRVETAPGKDGKSKKIVYIEAGSSGRILLTEYLSAFDALNRRGIGVAFAEPSR